MVYTINAHSDLLANLSFSLFIIYSYISCYLPGTYHFWSVFIIFFMTSFSEKLSFCLPGKISFLPSSHCWKLSKSLVWNSRWTFFFPGHWRQESTNFRFSLLMLWSPPVICLLNPLPINMCSFCVAASFLLRAHLITTASRFPLW